MKSRKSKSAEPKRPRPVLTAFAEGMGALTDALQQQLGEAVHTGHRLTSAAEADGGWTLTFSTGTEVTCERLVLALPADNLADIAGLPGAVTDAASKIEYVPMAVVALAFPEAVVSHPLDGFGFVVPRTEQCDLLGCIFSSSIFPNRAPSGEKLLRVMIGGARRPDLVDSEPDELVRVAVEGLRPLIGLSGEPSFSKVVRWPRAIPQYLIGHREVVAGLDRALEAHPNLSVLGNAFRGVGVPDCVKAGLATASAPDRRS